MAGSLVRQQLIAPVEDDDVTRLSQSAGIKIAKKDVPDYRDLINGFGKLVELLYDIPDEKPNQDEMNYPRNPGTRPEPKDNPHNAWYVKTEIKGAPSGILAGKRIAIKDNVAVAGVPMMNGSRLLEGHVPDYDATVVIRILKNGGTIAGKAVCENMTASGNSCTSATGPVLNPFDKKLTSGGSSSGSAVLVASGEVDMAIGSDTGGSIRIPASFCGIVGLKPTFGLVPTTGTVGIYPTFDHLGPMTKTVTDCAMLLQAIVKEDDFGGSSTPKVTKEDYTAMLNDGVKGLKIGLLKEGFEPCSEVVCDAVKKALSSLESNGACLKDISVPEHKLGDVILNIVASVGGAEILFKNGGIAIGTGQWHDVQVSERLQLGIATSSEDLSVPFKVLALNAQHLKEKDRLRTFAKAENLIPRIRKSFEDAFKDCDVIVLPTMPMVAPPLPVVGPESSASIKEIMRHTFGFTYNTSVFNITGHPAISVNVQQPKEVPIGMMIVAKHWQDALVLRVARAVEVALEKS